MTSHNESELRLKAITLINELRSGNASDDRQEDITHTLDAIMPDPNYWDYVIDHTPRLTAEEIVEKAFSYKPILL
ncbi:hypothetical protein [Agrobacterium sp. LAD9]|uniref:hypothetical protein n=1 Tax=Agrobacterium sp. LAD9 TaxID=2055153 RepID=UPI000D1FAB55|nr:hypothetical protein [Agrobacterium sp. LAD9]